MLRSYDEHKETSIPWTNRVPKSWLIQRGKSIFQNKKQLNTQKQCDNILSLTLKGVVNNSIDNPIGLVPKDYATYQIFEKDDLVFKLIDLENYQTSRVGLVHELGIMSPAYIRIALRKKDDFNIKYFFYQYYDLYLRRVFNQIGAGVRSTLSAKELLNIEILIPPREEQDQIVRFLDWKLAKINKLIRAKKKQIALLNEQRQVIIHNAVTKGVDPNVMMKDSGIEWISKIPTSWKKDKITRLFNIIGSGTTPSSGNSIYYENPTTPWINSGDLYSDTMYLSNTNKSVSQRAIDDYSVLKIYPSNTIVIAMYGASIGNLAITEIPACCNQACCCLSEIDQRLDIKYAYYLLKACKSFWIEKSKGGGQPNISQDIIKQTWLPLPPKTEQIKISQFLSYYESHFHRAIETIKHEIILIQEFRTRLISDVVTGKVDVRDIEIPEYEADSDETIDDEIDDNLVLDEEDGEMEVE